MIRYIPLCSAALGVTAAALHAQQPRDSIMLAPIVVTATRLPTPASDLASAVAVIEGDALRRAGIATVAEALRAVPSLALAQAGSWGAQTSLFLRGGENDHVRVLVDGVPLNQAGGALDLSSLSTHEVERIEVVRGPASVLYGSDAMTGVIQILTRQGRGPARLEAGAAAGSYGTTEARISAGGAGRALAVSGGVERQATDGTQPFNNGHALASAAAGARWTPDGRTAVGLSARYRDARYHYPTDGAGAVTDSNQVQDTRQLMVAVDAERRLSSRVTARLLLGADVRRDSTDNAPDSPGDTLGVYAYESRTDYQRAAADVRADVRVGRGATASLGAVLEDQREEGRNSYRSSFGNGGGAADVARTNRGLYGQLAAANDRLGVQAGVRLDDNQAFGTFVTWRAGASLRLSPATRLRASAGTAFKEPTFVENYATGFAVGNPALRPERSASAEAGLEHVLAGGRASVAATAFTQRFRDLIQYTFATAAPTDPNFYNAASASASGLELEARVAASPAVRLDAQYTWLATSAADSGFDGTVFAPDQRLVRRPTHSGSVAAEWRGARALLGARVLLVGTRDDLDFGGFPVQRVVLPAYGRLDLWARAAVWRAATLTLRVDNATGADYEEIAGFPAPGRRVLAGLSVSGR
jgi:vitamin B12 transporter